MPPSERQAEAGQAAAGGGGRPRPLARLLFALPVVVFAVMAAYFLWGLDPTRDPREVPSALIDEPVPAFDLPPLEGSGVPGLSSADLRQPGEVVLVNVFASWCIPCKVEHPLLMRLSREGVVAVYGINYKDKPVEAREWLIDLGNPYGRIGADRTGRAAIEWGVYGVPETFIVGPDGRIRYKHTGPIQPPALEQEILPMIEKLRG